MGDMGEIFKLCTQNKKRKREERNNKYIPILKKIGAIFKSEGIYEYNGWFLYPSKGFAMKKNDYKERMSIDELLIKGE